MSRNVPPLRFLLGMETKNPCGPGMILMSLMTKQSSRMIETNAFSLSSSTGNIRTSVISIGALLHWHGWHWHGWHWHGWHWHGRGPGRVSGLPRLLASYILIGPTGPKGCQLRKPLRSIGPTADGLGGDGPDSAKAQRTRRVLGRGVIMKDSEYGRAASRHHRARSTQIQEESFVFLDEIEPIKSRTLQIVHQLSQSDSNLGKVPREVQEFKTGFPVCQPQIAICFRGRDGKVGQYQHDGEVDRRPQGIDLAAPGNGERPG